MSTEPNAAAPLRFRGGTFGLLLPFAVLLSGMLLLAAAGKAMPAAFWCLRWLRWPQRWPWQKTRPTAPIF